MPRRGGQPPPAREMPLTPRPPEHASRSGILERHAAAGLKRQTAHTISAAEFHLDTAPRQPSTDTGSRSHQTLPNPDDHLPGKLQ